MSHPWIDTIREARDELSLSNEELDRVEGSSDTFGGCPLVVYQISASAESGVAGRELLELDSEDFPLERRLAAGVPHVLGAMAFTASAADASVFGLPGPTGDRGIALWGPGGTATFFLPDPATRVAVTCAALMDDAVVEFRSQADGAMVTHSSMRADQDGSPAVLVHDDPESPVSQIVVRFEGECSPSGFSLPDFLSRLKSLTAALGATAAATAPAAVTDAMSGEDSVADPAETASGGPSSSSSDRGGHRDGDGADGRVTDQEPPGRSGDQDAGEPTRGTSDTGTDIGDRAERGTASVPDDSLPPDSGTDDAHDNLTTTKATDASTKGASDDDAPPLDDDDVLQDVADDDAPEGESKTDDGPTSEFDRDAEDDDQRDVPDTDRADELPAAHDDNDDTPDSEAVDDDVPTTGDPDADDRTAEDERDVEKKDNPPGASDEDDDTSTTDETVDDDNPTTDQTVDDDDQPTTDETVDDDTPTTGDGGADDPSVDSDTTDQPDDGVSTVLYGEVTTDQHATEAEVIELWMGEDVDAAFVFIESCWETIEDQAYNQTIVPPADVVASNQQMIESINGSLRPLLRPNSEYTIEVTTVDKVSATGETTQTNTKSQWIGFRTKGPVGHFHEFPDGSDTAPHPKYTKDEFALETLEPYIDRDRSYPVPTGNLLGAKPMYFESPDVRLYFTKPFVERFFTGWRELSSALPELSASLELEIVDPAINPNKQQPPSIAPALQLIPATAEPIVFSADVAPVLPTSIQMLGNLIDLGPDCIGDLDKPEPPASFAEAEVNHLRPSALYTAVWKSTFEGAKRTVHSYQFQTSRYGTHQAQVHSYLPVKKADDADPTVARVFVIELDAAPDMAKLQAIASGNSPADLKASHASAYDQAVYGVLKLKELPAAVGTEFTAIMHDGKTWALLMRNPEPFNDPRMPHTTLERTVFGSGLSTIVSTDSSRALLVDAAGSGLAGGPAEITFEHWQFTSTGMAVASTETVALTIPPEPAPNPNATTTVGATGSTSSTTTGG